MIPYLLETDLSTHIGKLGDVISCVVTEERNGEFTLELEYPSDGENADQLDIDKGIAAKSAPDKPFQIFYITKVVKKMNGRISVYANHIRYLLKYCIVLDNASTTTGCQNTLNTIKAHTYPQVTVNRFTIASKNMSTTKRFKNIGIAPTTLSDLLAGEEGSVLDTFGGEWDFDNWNCTLKKNRGSDLGVQISYGVNLKELSYTIDAEEAYNYYVPWWEMSNGEYNHRPSTTYNLTESYRLQDAEGHTSNFTIPKVVLIDMTDLYRDNGNSLTTAQIQEYIKATYDDQWKVHLDSITVDFVNLRDTTEYADYAGLENVHLCDTVTVVHPGLGISMKEKVVKTVYDSILERYDEITIGMAKKISLMDVIAGKMKNASDIYKVE